MVREGLEKVQDRHLIGACNRAEGKFGGNGDARLLGIKSSADELALVGVDFFFFPVRLTLSPMLLCITLNYVTIYVEFSRNHLNQAENRDS